MPQFTAPIENLKKLKLGFKNFSFSNTLITVLLGVILIGGFCGNWKINQLHSDVAHFQNEAAASDEIHQIDSTTISKLTLNVRDITSSNEGLQTFIDRLKGEIRSQSALIATLTDSISNVSTDADTIIIDGDVQNIRTFNIAKNAFVLRGHFQLQEPYTITFEEMAAKIALELNLVQLRDGQWEAFVDTKNPSLLVTSLVTKVNPYRPAWWKKFNLSGGVYLLDNKFGLMGGVGYNKFLGIVGYDPRGYMLGVQYVF